MLNKQLMFSGALLFLLGLLEGVVIPYFTNTRMGLSAHLAAVQSAMALMVFGAIWNYVSLSDGLAKLAAWASIFSMYVVWLGLTLAGILGTSKATPIAGAGFQGSASAELLTETIITIGAGAGVIGAALIVWGLWNNLRAEA
jgi:hydroxylaminobenzene mutase